MPRFSNRFSSTIPVSRNRYFDPLSTFVWLCSAILESASCWFSSSLLMRCSVAAVLADGAPTACIDEPLPVGTVIATNCDFAVSNSFLSTADSAFADCCSAFRSFTWACKSWTCACNFCSSALTVAMSICCPADCSVPCPQEGFAWASNAPASTPAPTMRFAHTLPRITASCSSSTSPRGDKKMI